MAIGYEPWQINGGTPVPEFRQEHDDGRVCVWDQFYEAWIVNHEHEEHPPDDGTIEVCTRTHEIDHSRLPTADDVLYRAPRSSNEIMVKVGDTVLLLTDGTLRHTHGDGSVTLVGVAELAPLERRLLAERLRYWANHIGSDRYDPPITESAADRRP